MNSKALVMALAALGAMSLGATPTKQARIKVAGYAGGELADFPVLVRISPSTIEGFRYADCAQGGADVSFTDADGNALSHEIDTWNPAGESLVWVKVPKFANEAKFFMRWNDAEPPANAASSTWSADYLGVWHLGEEKNTAWNSAPSGMAMNALPGGNVSECVRYAEAGAPVGFARTTASTGDAFLAADGYAKQGVGSVFAMSGWVRLTDCASYGRLFGQKAAGANSGWEVEMAGTDLTQFRVRGSGDAFVTAWAPPPGLASWTHLAFVFENENAKVYVNGDCVASGYVSPVTPNGFRLVFGNYIWGQTPVHGAFDECRLMRRVASSDWVKAEYAAVKGEGFLAYGKAKNYVSRSEAKAKAKAKKAKK